MFLYHFYVFIILFASLNEMRCLRVTELRLSPWAVRRGGRAALQCMYELQGAPLYCVKWYRGRHEFYRYSPADKPSARIFAFSGINVDLSESNSTQVVLQRVGFALTGNFSCEVSADAPSFSTAIVSAYMEVVELPEGPPVIATERPHYDPGDILRANCTVPPSRPPVTLTFFINQMQISPGLAKSQLVEDGLYRADLSISFLLLPEHYLDGPPVLRCTGKITNKTLYNESAEIHLRESDGPPRLGRVTSTATANHLQTINILNLVILSIIVAFYSTLNNVFQRIN